MRFIISLATFARRAGGRSRLSECKFITLLRPTTAIWCVAVVLAEAKKHLSGDLVFKQARAGKMRPLSGAPLGHFRGPSINHRPRRWLPDD